MSERERDRLDDAAGEGAGGSVDAPAIDPAEELPDPEATAEELAPHFEQQEAPDAADVLERLEPSRSAEVLHAMRVEAAAEALSYMTPALAATVVQDLEEEESAELIGLLSLDDAVDLVQALPSDLASALLKRVPPKRAAEVAKLALYDPESAGGIMTTDIMVVRADRRIGQAIDAVKRHSINETQTDVYCIDEGGRLVGTIGLRTLLVADDGDAVSAHMEGDPVSVTPGLDREEVARLIERYDLVTLPVVDAQQRVLGMVTIDDVIDAILSEQTEDALKQVGAGPTEAVYSRVRDKLKGRLPWLAVNLALASLGAMVILAFEGLIAELAVLAVLYPIIANQSGNSGQQSMALTLRGLVLNEIPEERIRSLLWRESIFGAVTGVVIGLMFAGAIGVLGLTGVELFESMSWQIGLVAGLSMAGALAAGCVVGTSVPLLMERLGADPASASAIFVTMFTDALSYFTFLGLVFLARSWLMPGAG